MADNDNTGFEQTLFNKYAPLITAAALSVSIYNKTGQHVKTLGLDHYCSGRAYRIYVGDYNVNFEDPRYEIYFCNSENELIQILDYICAHLELFVPVDDYDDILRAEETTLISIDGGELDHTSANAVIRRF